MADRLANDGVPAGREYFRSSFVGRGVDKAAVLLM